MNETMLIYSCVMMFGVFISAVSQVLLKKAAMRSYSSTIAEYLNPFVITAYTIFVVATFMTIFAYKVIPLSLGPVLEATSYIYVTAFGVIFFQEKVTPKKILALALIILGILIYSSGI